MLYLRAYHALPVWNQEHRILNMTYCTSPKGLRGYQSEQEGWGRTGKALSVTGLSQTDIVRQCCLQLRAGAVRLKPS